MKRKVNKGSVRPHLVTANIGEMTQGTVFSCTKVLRYVAATTFGLVITARCDISQDKYPVLNYLPVVPISSWLAMDGLSILITSETKNFDNKIKGYLKQAQISESLLLSVGLNEIANTHFPQDTPKKNDQNRAQKFAALIEEKLAFDTLAQTGDNKATFRWFAKNREKDVRNIVLRLSKHDVAGYYFFEQLLSDDAETAYVCLLRDVAAIPRELAIQISNGLNYHSLSSQPHLKIRDFLDIPDGELAMPVSCIGSPTIEHVMQTFANLFGRIGLDDPDDDKLDGIVTRCCSY